VSTRCAGPLVDSEKAHFHRCDIDTASTWLAVYVVRMKRPPAWIAWLIIIVLVGFDGYLKFQRDASFWLYGPAVLLSLAVGAFLFGDQDDDADPEKAQE
jgi:hypothetical protein